MTIFSNATLTGYEFPIPAYASNFIVRNFRNAPRFGHSQDISQLFSGDQSNRVDYIVGTIFIGGICISLFLLWVIILVLFTYLGSQKVGYLSGDAIQVQKAKFTAEFGELKASIKPMRVRVIFILCCVTVMAMAIVSYFFGFKPIADSFDVVSSDILDELVDITIDAKNLTTTISNMAKESTRLGGIISNELQNQSFCYNIFINSNASKDERDTVIDVLQELDTFAADNFPLIDTQMFEDVRRTYEDLQRYILQYRVRDWMALSYPIAVTATAGLLMIGTFQSWCSKLKAHRFICFLTWFLMPVFMILVALSWVLCSVVGVGIVMNSDICYGDEISGGPDVAFLNILDQKSNQKMDDSQLIYETMMSWVTGCQSTFPFPNILTYINELNRASEIVQNFTSTIQEKGQETLNTSCEEEDFNIIPSLNQLSEKIRDLSNSAQSSVDVVGCQRLSPLYVSATHDTLCTDLPHALFWSGLGLVVISLFGMLTITLRAAYLEVEFIEESTDSSSVNSSVYNMQDIYDQDKEYQPSNEVKFEENKSPSRQRPLPQKQRRKEDKLDIKGQSKTGIPNPINNNTEKDTGLAKNKSTKSDGTMSWEQYPIKPFPTRISSRKQWDMVSVADDAALKLMPPLSTNPSFRVY
eukprot:CAMPEP_0198260752 /NCGR_PEP_ID=MMETSP1447-20131203/9637_1 /TAXON_ID=420782 /ORGANISM="Chaetoceros dichaeta, Strain CCMP1751" /LENGTH=639 /DNA_ID=CAMNT_0043948477 /DNA_START=101 /DNA_END=2020 /DNA_ORIENTATION=-